jgi:hypothetical protein
VTDDGDRGAVAYDALAAFIADAPLYSWLDLGDLWGAETAKGFHDAARIINLGQVDRYCRNPRCEMVRPFARVGGDDPDSWAFHEEPGGHVYAFAFLCTGCNAASFQCWVETHPEYDQPEKRRIRKVGQTPPWDISVPADIREAFGEDAGLYKSAREVMSHSYGMAACAYLRRILENRITPLLKALRDVRQAEGASEEDLRTIEEALRARTAENRIRLANEALPDSIKIAGVKPLALLYDRLSDALHRRDEQECMDIAEQVSKPLEYIITNLSAIRRQQRERRAYEEEIMALRRDSEQAPTH